MHMWEMSKEYDYRLDMGSEEKRTIMVAALQYAHRNLLGRELEVKTLSAKELDARMITKASVRERAKTGASAETASATASRRSLVASVASGRMLKVSNAPRGSIVVPHMRAQNLKALFATEAEESEEGNDGSAATAMDGAARKSVYVKPTDPLQALRAAVGFLRSLAATLDDASIRAVLAMWPEETILSFALIFAEALYSPNCGEVVLKETSNAQSSALVCLHAASEGLIFRDDAAVRAWCMRSLWRLLQHFKQATLLQDEVRMAGGFDGYVVRSFVAASRTPGVDELMVPRLEAPVSQALMEILIDGVTRPSENATTVETFGKLLARPDQLRLMFRLLPTADWQVKHDIMKEMNVLLIKREDNFPRILEIQEWMAWLVPLLANLPRRAADRTELMNEYLKYVMNFFTMLMQSVYQTTNTAGGDLERQLSRMMTQLRMQAGWNDCVVNVARNLLASLVAKVAQSCKRWQRKYDRPEWENLFKLANSVEDFIFYRPVMDVVVDDDTVDVPLMVYVPATALQPGVPLKVAPFILDAVDRTTPGLH
ncbi:hypothetical protein EON62_02050, partial [archaeon]